jgi:SAM-dependent methyltransferase
MSSNVVDEQADMYGESIEKHGDTTEGLIWGTRVKQRHRFQQLVSHLSPELESFSLLDVGCGTADLHAWLDERGIEHDYTGLDVTPEVLEIASEKFDDIELVECDLAEHSLDSTFDFVTLSGTLHALPDSVTAEEMRAYALELLEGMFEHTRYAMVFNFMTTYVDYRDDELLYLDPTELFDFCQREFSRHVVLDHAYGLYEGMIAVYTKRAMEKRLDPPSLERYCEE